MSKTKKTETEQLALRMAQQLKKDVYDLRGRISEKRLAAAITQALIGTSIPDEAADLRVQQLREEYKHELTNEVWNKTEEARKLKHEADMLKMEYERKTKQLDEQQERDKKTAEAVRTLLEEFFAASRGKNVRGVAHMFAPPGWLVGP